MNWITSGFELVASVILNFSPGLESLLSFLMNTSFSSGNQQDEYAWPFSANSSAYNECICTTTAYFVCCQKTNEICLILFIWKECWLISVSLCIFSYHNNCGRHISSLATIVFVACGWLFFIPIKHHTAQSILCPEKGPVLYCPNTSACVAFFYHLMICSNEPPSITSILYGVSLVA